MTNKRKHETLEQVLARPWCYYCERDFDNLKVLVDHQKARHFQCHVGTCHRRLNTVGGLRVHMAQVHKAELHEAPNAIDRRKDINIEVFGMEGVPESLKHARDEIVRRAYEEMEAEHVARTGNPLPGSDGAKARVEAARQAKKPKIEPKEETKRRLAERKAQLEAKKAARAAGLPVPGDSSTPPVASTPQSVQGSHVQNTPTPPAMAAFAAPPSIPTPSNAMPPGYGGLPLGMPPGLGMSSTTNSAALPNPVYSNAHESAQVSNLPARPSLNDSTPEPRFNGYSKLDQDDPESRLMSAPTLTKQQVTANIDDLWKMFEAEKAADEEAEKKAHASKSGYGRENLVHEHRAQGHAKSILESQEMAGVANPRVPPGTTYDPPSVKDSGLAKDKAAAGRKAQHSKLQIRDNTVSPEEKRARAGRYQLKPKTSTMPTFTPTQGVAGAVDA